MESTFAIVGTAGRKDDAARLSVHNFTAMCECAKLLIQQFNESNYRVDTLVSGGAAWADHVAVKLYLQKMLPHLKLFLPCPYDADAQRYDETPLTPKEATRGYSTGKIANDLHRRFTKKVGFDSLGEIFLAIKSGAEIVVGKGFYARNALVAQSDVILAMTFGDKNWVKEGGTSHTIMTYLNRVKKQNIFDKSFHYDLNSGDIHMGAGVRGEV